MPLDFKQIKVKFTLWEKLRNYSYDNRMSIPAFIDKLVKQYEEKKKMRKFAYVEAIYTEEQKIVIHIKTEEEIKEIYNEMVLDCPKSSCLELMEKEYSVECFLEFICIQAIPIRDSISKEGYYIEIK